MQKTELPITPQQAIENWHRQHLEGAVQRINYRLSMLPPNQGTVVSLSPDISRSHREVLRDWYNEQGFKAAVHEKGLRFAPWGEDDASPASPPTIRDRLAAITGTEWKSSPTSGYTSELFPGGPTVCINYHPGTETFSVSICWRGAQTGYIASGTHSCAVEALQVATQWPRYAAGSVSFRLDTHR
jgi:hypothetical protein